MRRAGRYRHSRSTTSSVDQASPIRVQAARDTGVGQARARTLALNRTTGGRMAQDDRLDIRVEILRLLLQIKTGSRHRRRTAAPGSPGRGRSGPLITLSRSRVEVLHGRRRWHAAQCLGGTGIGRLGAGGVGCVARWRRASSSSGSCEPISAGRSALNDRTKPNRSLRITTAGTFADAIPGWVPAGSGLRAGLAAAGPSTRTVPMAFGNP
jgi:hypothetical protein